MISKRVLVIVTALLFACLNISRVHAQAATPWLPKPPEFGGHAPGQPSEVDERMEEVRLKKAKEQRKEQMKRDTDRLVQLSTEVKTFVDKSDENILSLDVIKKMDEIQKLSRNIEEKMKQ